MISVCMATYNGQRYIGTQLRSILAQIGPEDEVIISDDASTDMTLEVIAQINDERIKVYHHTCNHGYTPNFENALKYAKGNYIFLADQDDEWLPGKVEKMLEALKNADFVVSDCITIDDSDTVLDQSRFKTYHIKKGFWRLMIKTRYLGCCMAFRRCVLDAALPFPANSFYIEHDLWLAAVAECYFRVVLVPQALILYKRHEGNASDAGMGKGYPLRIKILRRMYRLQQLWLIRSRVKRVKEGLK